MFIANRLNMKGLVCFADIVYIVSIQLVPFMQENPSTLEKDETLSILVNMGYAIEEALTATDKCGTVIYVINTF